MFSVLDVADVVDVVDAVDVVRVVDVVDVVCVVMSVLGEQSAVTVLSLRKSSTLISEPSGDKHFNVSRL